MTTVDYFSTRPKGPDSISWLSAESLFSHIEEQFDEETALLLQAQDRRKTSNFYAMQQSLYEDDVFVAQPGSPLPPGRCITSSLPMTPPRSDESDIDVEKLAAQMYSASQQENDMVMPPPAPTPHRERERAFEPTPQSPVAPPYSPIETTAVHTLVEMDSGSATTSVRKRTLETFSNTVIAQCSTTTLVTGADDEVNGDDEPLAKRVARGAPKKSGRSRESYKLPKPVQRLCATDEERERLIAAATWPLRDVSLRGNLLPNAKLLLWTLRASILALPEVVGMTMAQHKELAANGLAATGIPEVVMQHYQLYALRYLLAVPDGQYVTTDANFRIEATMLDQTFYWSCKQGAKRQLLLEKWGGTQQSCSGVFTVLSSVARHLYAEAKVRARGAREPILLANLDSTRFTVPGKSPKFDSKLKLPRTGRPFRKLIVEVVPAELETSVAKFVALTEDMTCLEQSVPAGASKPLVAVKHLHNTNSPVAANKPIASTKTASSAQTSGVVVGADITLHNIQEIMWASTQYDEELASAMLDPIVSIDEILANKNK